MSIEGGCPKTLVLPVTKKTLFEMKVLARSKSSCVNTWLQGVNQSKDGEQKGQLSLGAHPCKWDKDKMSRQRVEVQARCKCLRAMCTLG